MIDFKKLTEKEFQELRRQMVNAYARERYAKRTPEQIERDRKRKQAYMKEYAKRKKAAKEQ